MNNVNIDSVYKIGSSHDVCQDYVMNQKIEFENTTTKERDSFNVLVLCDGCSGSHEKNKKVDFGVKLLAWEVIRTLKNEMPYYITRRHSFSFFELDKNRFCFYFIDTLMNYCEEILEHYQLPSDILDATIFVTIEYKGNALQFNLGDGVCYWKKKDDVPFYKVTTFNSNAPFYFSYLLQGVDKIGMKNVSRINSYLEEFGKNSCTSEVFSLNESIFRKIFFIDDYDYDLFSDAPQTQLYSKYMEDTINIVENVDYIGMTSDGVCSFVKENNDFIDEHQLIKDLFNYKNFNGEFVKRKINFFDRNWKKNNIKHHDDISFVSLKTLD